jgi:hypothetical protein
MCIRDRYIDGSWYVTDEYRSTQTYMRYYSASYDETGNITYGQHDETLFDVYGAQIENFIKTNDGSGWIQIHGDKTIITYEGATSKVLEKVYQNWDGDAEMYLNYMREVYEYTATNLDDLEKTGIKIFPTAFQSNLAVQSALTGKVFIYNLAGTKVLERTIDAGINTINTADLENGYYIVKVSTKQGDSIQKAIKH